MGMEDNRSTVHYTVLGKMGCKHYDDPRQDDYERGYSI